MGNLIPSDLRAPDHDIPALAPAATRVGHVNLRVSDLGRAVRFYETVVGLELRATHGVQLAFLSAGGYHHHVALNTWESEGASPPPRGHTGLLHVAFVVPDRRALAQALARVLRAGVALDGHADHIVTESIYFRDPDGNGVEVYRDRDPAELAALPDGGAGKGPNDPLDLHALLAQA